MIANPGETYTAWRRRHRGLTPFGVADVAWGTLFEKLELEEQIPNFKEAIEFTSLWLYEPGMASDPERWVKTVLDGAWNVPLDFWREGELRRAPEFWLTVDEQGREVRFHPRDRTRPNGCCYVCVRRWFGERQDEITFPLGDAPPPSSPKRPWTLMREPVRSRWGSGRTGWWRFLTHPPQKKWRRVDNDAY